MDFARIAVMAIAKSTFAGAAISLQSDGPPIVIFNRTFQEGLVFQIFLSSPAFAENMNGKPTQTNGMSVGVWKIKSLRLNSIAMATGQEH